MKHLVIPDCQVKDGVCLDYLDWIGQKVVIFAQDGIRNPAGGATVHGLRIKTNAVRAKRINPLQAQEESGL